MLQAPEPLTSDHDIAGFDYGVASLNTWLERRAVANQVSVTKEATRQFARVAIRRYSRYTGVQ